MKFIIIVMSIAFSFQVSSKSTVSLKKSKKVETIIDFKGQFFYEILFKEDEPPTTSECHKIEDTEINKYAQYKCDPADEMNLIFEDWSCSNEVTNQKFLAISANKAKCEKALQNFRGRH